MYLIFQIIKKTIYLFNYNIMNTYVEKNMSDFDILYDNGETGSARNLVRRAKKGEAYDNCK